ncbi:phage fiber-tail adaptor protein, partial [Streptococcus pneumoniae]|uniref:phage fiber-tail adaptor protein n=1 Tax=Streptococcus pneumoniae TaxID=1313 RepID=UPI0018B0A8DB
LDYSIDWNAWLASANNDTIAIVAWTVDAGLTKHNESLNAGISTVFLSGGEVGIAYKVNAKVTTNSVPLRIIERGFTVNVK